MNLRLRILGVLAVLLMFGSIHATVFLNRVVDCSIFIRCGRGIVVGYGFMGRGLASVGLYCCCVYLRSVKRRGSSLSWHSSLLVQPWCSFHISIKSSCAHCGSAIWYGLLDLNHPALGIIGASLGNVTECLNCFLSSRTGVIFSGFVSSPGIADPYFVDPLEMETPRLHSNSKTS